MKKTIYLLAFAVFLSCIGQKAEGALKFDKKRYYSHAHYRLIAEEARLKKLVVKRQGAILKLTIDIKTDEVNKKYAKEETSYNKAHFSAKIEKSKAEQGVLEQQLNKEKKQLSEVRSAIDKMEAKEKKKRNKTSRPSAEKL